MNTTFKLGRIAGIDVGINWSWLIVLVLMVWTLAAGIFPAENPGLSDATYLAMAGVAAAVFFLSLFLHEMGHAVTARRLGMQIDGITLWLFGGVARFRGMFPNAGTEFRVAIAGPLVSIGLGLAFVAFAGLTSLGRAVDGVAAWLGYINLVLAAFNLLPAQPLDGGRVLHSVLWRVKGDLVAATRAAGRAGELLGYVMITGGLVLFITLGAFSGAWLAFLGWFLLTAAREEVRMVLVHQALGGLRVRALMSPNPVTVVASSSLAQFVDDVAWGSRFSTYPVLDGGRVTGLLRFRDVAAVPRHEWERTRVEERMIPREEVVSVAPDDPAGDAFDAVATSPVGRALVFDGERLVGIFSITDAIRVIQAGGTRHPDAPA